MQSGSEKSFVVFTAFHSVIAAAADSLCRVKTPTRAFSHLRMTAMKNLLRMIVLSTIMVLAFSPLFSSAQAAQAANVVDYGATPDDDTDDTHAFEAALEDSREIYIPEGTFIAEVNITSSNTVIRSSGTVKARNGAKHIFCMKPLSGWLTDCIIEGGTLDMSGMADSNASSALFLNFTWGNRIADIRVINQPADASAIWLEDSVYTTLFENLDVGSTAGRITIHGKSYINQAVTTCTFTSCAFGQVCLSDVDGITFVSPVVQGSLDKFIMKNASNISIYSGDIEGDGIFLKIESNVNNVYSIGNSLSGLTGTYRQGTIEHRYVLMDDYSFSNNTFSLSDGSSSWSDASFSIRGAGSGQNPKFYVQNPPGHYTAWLADFNNLHDGIGNNGMRINILNKDSKIASFCAGNNEIASIDGKGNFNLTGDLNITGRIISKSPFSGLSISELFVQNPSGNDADWLADLSNLKNEIGNNGLRVNILNNDSKIASFCVGNDEKANIDAGGNLNLAGNLTLSGSISSPLSGLNVSAYASGQNYILDTIPSPLEFSEADPCIVIPAPGTWLIMLNAAIDCNKASYSYRMSRDLKLALYRANNNPGYLDLNKAVAYSTIPVIRKFRGTLAHIGCNYIYHTAESDDLIQVYGSVSTLPRRGTIGISPPTSLIAIKLD
jgi:hypothetical protein